MLWKWWILISSKNFIEDNHVLDEKQKNFLKYETFRGWEIVPTTYKMSLMNLFLHNISDFGGKLPITRADSLLSDPGERFDYVLTNPPLELNQQLLLLMKKETKKKKTQYIIDKIFGVLAPTNNLIFYNIYTQF